MKWQWSWMMNKTLNIYHELLLDLQEHPYDPNRNISRECDCDNGVKLIYSIAAGSRTRLISIPIDQAISDRAFPTWKGVSINLVNIPEYAPETQTFVELHQSADTEGDIFVIVADDIRREMGTLPGGKHTANKLIEILKKWHVFFSQGKKPIIPALEAQGLYGELLFLKELILSIGTQSIGNWEGGNNTHDYYIGQNAVEVKTCSTQNPYKAHISSEHQLDNRDVNGRLFLRFYALRKDHNGGQRLPEIIEEIRELLKMDTSGLEQFNSKIFKLGYLDAAEDFYTDGYTIRDTYSFEIKEGFPRIVMRNVPSGVSNLEYDLTIGQCMDYVIDAEKLMKGVKS